MMEVWEVRPPMSVTKPSTTFQVDLSGFRRVRSLATRMTSSSMVLRLTTAMPSTFLTRRVPMSRKSVARSQIGSSRSAIILGVLFDHLDERLLSAEALCSLMKR